MKARYLILLSLGVAILILIPSTEIQARLKSKAIAPAQDVLVGSENVETIVVDEVAERQDYSLRVVILQRVDAKNGIIVNVSVQNRSGEDWLLTPQNFTLQDREHKSTYVAQAYDGKNALVPGLLHAGETRTGALRFDASMDGGLDLVFGVPSDSQAISIQLIP